MDLKKEIIFLLEKDKEFIDKVIKLLDNRKKTKIKEIKEKEIKEENKRLKKIEKEDRKQQIISSRKYFENLITEEYLKDTKIINKILKIIPKYTNSKLFQEDEKVLNYVLTKLRNVKELNDDYFLFSQYNILKNFEFGSYLVYSKNIDDLIINCIIKANNDLVK